MTSWMTMAAGRRMKKFFFISYSRAEEGDFATTRADKLAVGPPAIPVFAGGRTT
jgi:hypothetical protein